MTYQYFVLYGHMYIQEVQEDGLDVIGPIFSIFYGVPYSVFMYVMTYCVV